MVFLPYPYWLTGLLVTLPGSLFPCTMVQLRIFIAALDLVLYVIDPQVRNILLQWAWLSPEI